MYDILQLNDMLLPELQDIAENLQIDNPKKLTKQELVYKILDQQAVVGSQKKSAAPADGDKRKRKRIVKASTSNTTEEAVVEDTSDAPEVEVVPEEPKKIVATKKAPVKKEEKPQPNKRPKKKGDEQPTLPMDVDVKEEDAEIRIIPLQNLGATLKNGGTGARCQSCHVREQGSIGNIGNDVAGRDATVRFDS